ncbi:MAG: cytochrome c, partial [Halothiobacillaceae bacterium]
MSIKPIIAAVSVLICTPLYAADAPASASNKAPQATGEMMAMTCAGCHGTEGRLSDSAFVPLAGMKESTFIKA